MSQLPSVVGSCSVCGSDVKETKASYIEYDFMARCVNEHCENHKWNFRSVTQQFDFVKYKIQLEDTGIEII